MRRRLIPLRLRCAWRHPQISRVAGCFIARQYTGLHARERGATADVTLEYMGHHASSRTLDHVGDFTTTRRVLPISGLAVAMDIFAALVAAALHKLIGRRLGTSAT